MPKRFSAQLIGRGPNGAWTFLAVPFDVAAAFGSRARVAVRGTINGAPFRNSLLPNGDGTHSMPVNKDLQALAGARAGDTVAVVMDVDREPRTVTVPADLYAALEKAGSLAERFASLSVSHKREFLDWIESAKKEETRSRRIDKTLEMLAAGKSPKA
jgi:hypothetical protein